jgi:hypothetical protein
MESLLVFRRALASPTMCRFIPALSVPKLSVSGTGQPAVVFYLEGWRADATLLAMLFWSSLRSALGSAALHPLTAALLLTAFCLILWWLYKLFTHRLSTLAGVITIQGEPLPLFDIEAQAVGTTPRLWRLQQACERGTFALYDVPAGPLKLDFSFGTAASCKCTATVTVTKGRNLLDLDLSLELDRLDVQRTITPGSATSTVTWTFRKPTASPPATTVDTTSLKLQYFISHTFKDAQGAAHCGNTPVAPWSMPTAPAPWDVSVPIASYASAGEAENWSVEVYADGFPDIKKVSRLKK